MRCQISLALLTCLIASKYEFSTAEDFSTNSTSSNLKDHTKSVNETVADKLKRLRVLRAEVKLLAAELRGDKIDEIILGSKKQSNSTESRPKGKKQWKKRMHKRISRLSKRLSKLERAVIVQQESIKLTHGKASKHVRKPTQPTLIMKNTAGLIHQKSRPGYHQSPCTAHKDCMPGHCCHHKELTSHCIRHALNETNICRHSCQCNSDLHCFKPRKTDDGNDKHSHCKQAHVSDVALGAYENTREGVFDA
ncbi:hypothetical protein M3Y97_00586500 [Aphelenchoides bicaudatus]|nr:hypothetical protein M3Y97_00586500 [Aphelenchoides bicaudatus]